MAKSAEKIATDYTDLMKGRLGQMGRVCSTPTGLAFVDAMQFSPGFARGY